MLVEFAWSISYWSWLWLGLILLTVELFLPGLLFVWLGGAALLLALLTKLAKLAGYDLYWMVQVVAFILLAFIVCYSVLRWQKRKNKSPQAVLNQPIQNLLGLETVLYTALKNGTGAVRVRDVIWPVKGPELPRGAPVILARYEDGYFIVEPIEAD